MVDLSKLTNYLASNGEDTPNILLIGEEIIDWRPLELFLRDRRFKCAVVNGTDVPTSKSFMYALGDEFSLARATGLEVGWGHNWNAVLDTMGKLSWFSELTAVILLLTSPHMLLYNENAEEKHTMWYVLNQVSIDNRSSSRGLIHGVDSIVFRTVVIDKAGDGVEETARSAGVQVKRYDHFD